MEAGGIECVVLKEVYGKREGGREGGGKGVWTVVHLGGACVYAG